MTDKQLKALIHVKRILLNAWAELYTSNRKEETESITNLCKEITILENKVNRLLGGEEDG